MAKAVTLLSNGDIIVGGQSDGEWTLVSLDTDGNINWNNVIPTGGTDDQLNGLSSHNGFIVAAGAANDMGDYNFAVGQFDTSGNPDPSFGTGGIVETDFGGTDDGARAVAIKNGKIIAAGERDAAPDDDFALVRYTT